MHRPVLVTPPALTPVSLAEAKMHLRVAEYDEEGAVIAGDDDGLIAAYIDTAVSYLDGWTGILGRCLVEQTWRQDFDGFCTALKLPLSPVMEIVSITWRNAEGQISTINDSEYSLDVDAGGGARARFRNGFAFPSGLYESRAVSVTYKAGWPSLPAVDADPGSEPPVVATLAISTVPSALKIAILLLVGEWYDNREASAAGSAEELPFAVTALIAPFRRVFF